MSYNPYHWCAVPECKSSSVKTPKKLWIKVPNGIKMRNTWLKLAGRDPNLLSIKTELHFCEDHFDLEYDMENYMQYKIMGSVKRIRMKPNCIPSRFDCQTDKKHESTPNEKGKRQRMSVSEESQVKPSSSYNQDLVTKVNVSPLEEKSDEAVQEVQAKEHRGVEASSVDMEAEVKLERVKTEKGLSDDEFDEHACFDYHDDDLRLNDHASVDMEREVKLEHVKIEQTLGDDELDEHAGVDYHYHNDDPSVDMEREVKLEHVKIEQRLGDDELDEHAGFDYHCHNDDLSVDLKTEVKLEPVKEEDLVSDDDLDDHSGYDSNDELDDEPVTTLASKMPKEEPLDSLDMLDDPEVAEKRNSNTKTKGAPSNRTNKETIQPTPSRTNGKKMDERNKSTDEWTRKRELGKARMRKYRQRKRSASKQLDSMAQKEKRKKEPATGEIKKNTKIQTEEEKAQQRKELARERSRRYREKKRISALKTVDYLIHDSQIPGPSHANPPFVTRNQSTAFHDSPIAGTSTNMNIPRIVDHDLENENHNDEYPTEFSQANRSSATYRSYIRDSSAHIQFHKQFVQNGFGHTCKICDRLWFKNDLKNLNDQSMEFVRTFLSDIDENPIAVCSTCRASILKECIPNLAVHNGFKYPVIPDNLLNCPLDLVSDRLISPRIPFKQIRRLLRVHGQYGIYGQVINVPVEVNTMVYKLPRNINDDHCIYVDIKRRKIHKSSYVGGLVNKQNIKEWLQYLVNTPLYRTYNITIDEKVFDNEHGEEVQPEGSSGIDVGNRNDGLDVHEIGEYISIEESLLSQQQTLMWNDDLYLRIPSGEINLPISLLFDNNAEELSFPSIYLGQVRQFREGVIVTPFIMASSELRRSDRRGVTPHHLLYMAMKIMRIRVKASLTMAFKHVGKKSNFIKEEIQSEDYIHNCIESNLAFLRSIPNSTWYWSERKKDLFAMIRQLGKPTVFFSISANEIGWLDLLQLLYKLNTRDNITKDAVSQLHFMLKSTLINEDAVTCAIYFNKLVNVVMNILQSKKCSPFRKYRVLHYFKRIELQHQGSPRAHILAWLDNSPNDALNDDYDKAIELIDSLISVSAAEASGNIKLQTHKHTFTCYNRITANKEQKCRFEAPFMPCKKTMILTPMRNKEKEFNSYRKRYAEIRARLENEDFVDLDDFYNRNGIHSDEDYCNIIRAGINRPTVFVKREPSEKWHRPFNPFILNVVQSNTDFQFITEEYSCAAYVVEYVNKTNRGVSHLQRKIIETMDEHPEFDIIDATKNISVNILNHTEITSQEAAWYLLREPMSKSSAIIVYIPTVWPIERQRIRKTMRELSELDDDCTDVWKESWFDKYERRPEYLENITLAQFVSKYTGNSKGEFVELHEPKIIRYRNYDMATDFNEYKREMVTLHLPFRNEEEEILAEMKYIFIYDNHEDIILERRKEFESNIDIDKTIQIYRELCREETLMDEDEIQDVANRFPEGNPF